MDVKERIEQESERARDIHQSAAAMHAIGMEAGFRLAIEALKTAPHARAGDFADYLESLLAEGGGT